MRTPSQEISARNRGLPCRRPGAFVRESAGPFGQRLLLAVVALGLARGASCLAADASISLKEIAQHHAVVQVPGATAKVVLARMWGQTKDRKEWTARDDEMPALVFTPGTNYIEVSIRVSPQTNELIRICQFELQFAGGAAWRDDDGARTLLRRDAKWPSTAELLAPRGPHPARWAWPVASGYARLTGKAITPYAMTEQGLGTEFVRECFKDVPPPLQAVDASAIVRADTSGQRLIMATDQAIAVGYEGNDRLRLCTVARNLTRGQTVQVRMRIFLLGASVPDATDRVVASLRGVPLHVVFMGDSVGAALGSYADLSDRHLQETFPGKVRCLNASIGGNTTAHALSRYQKDALDYEPNLVVIQLCYNDVLCLAPEMVADNLRKMIDPVLATPGGRAIVLTPLSYDKKRVDDTLAKGTDINKAHTEQYIPALQKLVAEYEARPATKGKVGFVNIWQAMARVRGEKGAGYVLLPDGSHPGAEGHNVIADALWPELSRMAAATLQETGN